MKACCLALAVLAFPAQAADILSASYSAAADELVVSIAYRGTHPGHEFLVQWGECSNASPPRVTGRLVDRQGREVAEGNFRVSARIALDKIPCRPALATLRLGRVAHLEVFVPEARISRP